MPGQNADSAQSPDPGSGAPAGEILAFQFLLNRFDKITLKLWEKHGIRQAGFWTTYICESNQRLYYLLQWESMAEREKKWAAFFNDADWQKARAETEKDGAIVAQVTNEILQPTTFSSVK